MTATIAERVAAGAAFLNEHDPGWWREDVDRAIDLDALVMFDGDRCILGQRCPLGRVGVATLYYVYAAALSGNPVPPYDPFQAEDVIDEWAAALGFTERRDTEEWDEFDLLAAEWKRVIGQRRGAP